VRFRFQSEPAWMEPWEGSRETHRASLSLLNCGMGSSSLNAEVNAFAKLHRVRGANSSNCGLKYKSCHTAGEMLRRFERFFDKSLVNHELRFVLANQASFHVVICRRMGSKLRCMRSTADRYCIDEAEAFRVLRKHGTESPWKRHVVADEYAITDCHRKTHGLIRLNSGCRSRNGILQMRFSRSRTPNIFIPSVENSRTRHA